MENKKNDNKENESIDFNAKHGKNVTNVHVNVPTSVKGNSIGTAGFVLALLAFVFSWVPVLDWVLWALGAIFSVIGVFKKPKGLAIAGIVISFISIIFIIVVLGAILGVVGSLH